MVDFKNARPWPQIHRNRYDGKYPILPGKSKFVADNLSGGMVTVIDPADLDPNQLQMCRNARIRFDRLQRRPGTELLLPAKPNSNPVIGLFFFKKRNAETFYFRFSPNTIHIRSSPTVWTPLTAGISRPAAAVDPAPANTGTGLVSGLLGKAAAPSEVFTLTATTPTNFTVTGSVSGPLAAATAAVPYVSAFINFLINIGGTPFIAGDNFTIRQVGAGQLNGGAYDYIQGAVVLDKFVFANNGVDHLQEIDAATLEYIALGNAPKYRYVTGFYNRVVGAYFNGSPSDGALLGWSGDGNATEWDPLVDETAGSTPLVESPSDLGDFISGVFGFTNVMATLREQSIWLTTKKPIPTDPFHSYSAFPGIGCDAPYSGKITHNSITWADKRTETIWNYEPGGKPSPIGRKIEKGLFAGMDDQARIFGAYDSIQNEYTVCIPQASGNFVICWVYNFRAQTWVKDEREAITIASNADLAQGVMTIDELPGTIEGLTGTIDSLSPDNPVIPIRGYGRADGEVIIETLDDAITRDPPYAGSVGTYETELLSKSYTLPTDDVYIAEFRLGLVPRSIGTLQFEHSKDGGVTWASFIKTRTITGPEIGKPILFRRVRQVKCRRYAWRITASNGQWDVIDYEVHVYKAGESTS